MKTVLIVDEDAFTRNVFAHTLTQRGFRVCPAEDAAQARELAASEPIDIAVIDEVFCDGEHLVEDLRESGLLAPVILVTSLFREGGDPVPTEGVDLVLSKPISPAEFSSHVARLLDISEAVEITDDVVDEPTRPRRACLEELTERLRRLEPCLETLRADGDDFDDTHEMVATLRGKASRYGFFAISRCAGRIESALVRLRDGGGQSHRVLWSQVFDAFDDALLSLYGERQDPEAPAERQSATVMVVDDDPRFLEDVQSFGAEHMVGVVTVRDPSEVLHRLRESPVDALLVDIDLGEDFDAFEFVRRLRERAFVNRIPLGFIAEHGTVPDRVLAAHLGASVFLDKPLDSPQFAEVVHRLVTAHDAERPTVMIVDRDDGFVEETTEILTHAGIDCLAIDDTRDVIDRLDTVNPHGILIGAAMPGIGGFDLCRMIRAMPRWYDLPILLVGERMDSETRIVAFRSGADDYLVKPPLREELLARLQVRIERLRLLREQASVDMLTGLLTRRPFLQRVNARLSEVRRGNRHLALGLIDLDAFKEVNDTFGHIAGDRVLAALGRLLANRFRMEDLRSRWGGEEFTLALVDEDADTAERVLRRILNEFASMTFVGDDGSRFTVTFSAGVATFPDDGTEFKDLLTVADRRLYEAKALGRARIVSG